MTWDIQALLQPPLHSTAIRKQTPTVTPRRHFMDIGENIVSRRINEEINSSQMDDEGSHEDEEALDDLAQPRGHTFAQRNHEGCK